VCVTSPQTVAEAHRSGRPDLLPRAFPRRARQAENSPSAKAHRRAQTARPDYSELSSLISAHGRSGASPTGEIVGGLLGGICFTKK